MEITTTKKIFTEKFRNEFRDNFMGGKLKLEDGSYVLIVRIDEIYQDTIRVIDMFKTYRYITEENANDFQFFNSAGDFYKCDDKIFKSKEIFNDDAFRSSVSKSAYKPVYLEYGDGKIVTGLICSIDDCEIELRYKSGRNKKIFLSEYKNGTCAIDVSGDIIKIKTIDLEV